MKIVVDRARSPIAATLLVASALAVHVSAAAGNGPPTTLTILPSLPGATECDAWDISDSGEIVGICDIAAVRWTRTSGRTSTWQVEALSGPLRLIAADATIQDLPVLFSMATGINAAGTIVAQVVAEGAGSRVAIWNDDEGVWQAAGNASLGTPRDIDNQDRVIGTSTSGATVWDGAKVTLLPLLAGPSFCRGYAGNEPGDVVGICHLSSSSGPGVTVPVLWKDGVAIELPNQRSTIEFLDNFARAINEHGLIGGSADSHAVLWSTKNIDERTIVAELGSVNGINNGGRMVGYLGINGGEGELASRAAWWRSASDAPVLLFPAGNVSFARAINDRGDVVGNVELGDGTRAAFIAQ